MELYLLLLLFSWIDFVCFAGDFSLCSMPYTARLCVCVCIRLSVDGIDWVEKLYMFDAIDEI